MCIRDRGIAVTWLYGKGLLLISRYAHDEPSIQIVLMLLLPFIVYLVAEHFGLSGILAAVAAGLTTSRIGVVHHAPIRLRIKAKSSWSMLEYVFNGMVFLILGLQLPGIISESLIRAENDPLVDTGSLLLDVIWIYLALMVVRLGWLWLMRLYSRKRPGKHPMLFAGYKTRHMLLATFAGGRGAVSYTHLRQLRRAKWPWQIARRTGKRFNVMMPDEYFIRRFYY